MDGRQDMKDRLEAWIDSEGMDAVLCALSEVCGEKAEHIRTNWQDSITAKPWEKMRKLIDALASKRVV